jgi:hypothetical protein
MRKTTEKKFFKNINQTDKSSFNYQSQKRRKTHITKINYKSRGIIINLSEIKRIEIRDYEKLYANELDGLD